MFPALTFLHWLTLHGLVTLVAILLYVITSHVMQQRRNPAAAIAWMLFILLLPYLALPAFLAFGSRKLERPRVVRSAANPTPHGMDAWPIETIVALGQSGAAGYHSLNVHGNGFEARNALMEIIERARYSIDLCTFILRHDSLGDDVVDRLCRKAREGVRVRLMLDGLGYLLAGCPKLKRLTESGGDVALFAPPLKTPFRSRANLRNHRKLLVTDSRHGTGRLWCGGRNLAAEYFEGTPDVPAWVDLSFDLQGSFVQKTHALFERDWVFANQHKESVPELLSPDSACEKEGAQLVASGPDQVDDTVYSLLVTAAYRARRRIVLSTPYFVPESALLMALCLAARRGVAVDLLLPARSNHRLSDWARSRAMRALAHAGGRIWLAAGMLHAKLVVVDDLLALVGSANLDSRSLFLNYELMVAFHQAADVRRFAVWFDRERDHCHLYTATQPGLIRDVAEGMLLWIGFQL